MKINDCILLNKVERLIHKEVTSCHPRYWDENHITYNWIQKLTSEWKNIKPKAQSKISISWDAYKMSGKNEVQNGDIAFLVQINFNNGNLLQGVGFLEAKRVYDSGKFEALKWEQLSKQSQSFQSHQLLLYDHLPNHSPCHHYACCIFHCTHLCISSALVVPTHHAIAYKEEGRELESISHRLSEQIVFRYFKGLDLNFNDKVVKDVLEGLPDGPNFLVIATLDLTDLSDRKESALKPMESSRYEPILPSRD